jgi:vacuolar iron transporter family protein
MGMREHLKKLTNFTFGGASAIITNISLVVGLGTSSIPRSTIIGSLLIIAIADNISDSLGIHIYRESESVGFKDSFISTAGNFLTRLITSISFIFIVLAFPMKQAEVISIIWGMLLLGSISYLIAKKNNTGKPWMEIAKHLAIAAAVVIASKYIGTLIKSKFLAG